MATATDTGIRLAERIVALIDGDDLSQYAVAAKIGVNHTTLSKWRRRTMAPKCLPALTALAEHYGVSLDWLVGRTEVRRIAGRPAPERPAAGAARAALNAVREEAAELRAERDALRAEVAELRARLASPRHDGSKPDRPAEPEEAAEVRERAARLRAAKTDRYASGLLGPMSNAEIDAVMEGAAR